VLGSIKLISISQQNTLCLRRGPFSIFTLARVSLSVVLSYERGPDGGNLIRADITHICWRPQREVAYESSLEGLETDSMDGTYFCTRLSNRQWSLLPGEFLCKEQSTP
jgi:hypothetical protein